MRRQRGNIILAALFVAVFLFFLSVALLWTNRQDIALSLSMEHKLKAQSAARSAAMETYARLRRFGEAAPFEREMGSGAIAKVELVRVPSRDRHGQMLLVRARGQSGPVSSFFTMHLLETVIASASNTSNDGRVLVLTNGTASNAIYGDFKLSDLELGGDAEVSYGAYQGPLFAAENKEVQQESFLVKDYVPIFTTGPSPLTAYGPVLMVGPKTTDARQLKVLEYAEDGFTWTPLEGPEKELGNSPDPQNLGQGISLVHQFEAPGTTWSNLSLRGLGEAGAQYSWRDREPGTESKEEMEELALPVSFPVELAQAQLDWSEVPRVDPVHGYTMRGSVTAHRKKVYSHGWHYLYRHYDGRIVPPPVDEYLGDSVTRWPCILEYNHSDGEWKVAWDSLDESGDVKSSIQPDPLVLLVSSDGKLYSRTAEKPYKLLELKSGKVTVGAELPEGELFIYQDKPFAATQEGLLDVMDQRLIGFESLPARLGEINGMAVANQESNIVGLDSEIDIGEEEEEMTRLQAAGAAVSTDAATFFTTRPQYDFRYSSPTGVLPGVDGNDLWVPVTVEMTQAEPSYPLLGNPPFKNSALSALARYDGERWHIMPNGLRAVLKDNSLKAPATAQKTFAAHYTGLPEARARYTVLSVSTEGFDFSL